MAVLGGLLLAGLALTARWGGTAYRPWPADAPDDPGRLSPRAATLRYLRGVGIALVGGFWAGALVTGPAVRLIMRLLAVTASDDAQGMLTEAEEVVGDIDLGGTLGLYVFGGILPGLLSGALYLLLRRWLPSGRMGGVVFGLLHLVVAATRLDPLRADNPDFDIVGPGWLSVVTFSLAAIFHGMAVVAIANRYSGGFPSTATARAGRIRSNAPLVLPVLMLVPGVFLLVLITIGLVVTVVASQIGPLVRALRSGAAVVVGRVAIAVLAVGFLPGTLVALRDVIVRDAPVPAAAAAAVATDGLTEPSHEAARP